MTYRYIIHCQHMHREEAFVAKDFFDLMKALEKYVSQFGPIDLLYNVGRV